jgi:hypothetical protein
MMTTARETRAASNAAHAPADPADRTPITFVQQIDGAWHYWSVVEVDAAAVPGALGPRCLVFTRPECLRRVWHYPANWRTLDDAALTALSWHR